MSPLANIWGVNWRITIQNNPRLKSLYGLHNIAWFDNTFGLVEIINNDSLIDLSGLSPSMNAIDPDNNDWFEINYEIIDNYSLQNLEGISDCLNAYLIISNNQNLKSLHGCDSLQKLRICQIGKCPNMLSLEGLSGIDTVEVSLSIFDCPRIKNLKGMENARRIIEIRLNNLDSLETTEGLGSLHYTGSIEIDQCPNFRAIKDLEKLGEEPFNKWMNLRITNCPWFGDFTGISDSVLISDLFLDHLDSIETIINYQRVHTNDQTVSNCYNLRYLDAIPIGVPLGTIAPYFGATNCPNLEYIHDTISGRIDSLYSLGFGRCPKLHDVSALRYVRKVTGNFALENIVADSFTGTENIKYMRTVSVSKCNLKNLKFLSGLDSVSWYLYLGDTLHSLEGLENLRTVGSMEVYADSIINLKPIENTLTNIEVIDLWGLKLIDTIYGFNSPNFTFNKSYAIRINECPNLKAITGFNGIKAFPLALISQLYDNIEIQDNPQLQQITGFRNLEFLKKRLTIKNNPALTDMSGFCHLFQSGTIEGGYILQDNGPGANSLSGLLHQCVLSETKEETNAGSSGLSVFPNPATGMAIVQWSSEEYQRLELWSTDGRLVQSVKLTEGSRETILEPAANTPAGLYFLRLTSPDKPALQQRLVFAH
ncbi:MAG: T9SS type A sorting domain-containing protein [Saprospiraceae bacterium]|nr:T9SS type A sorting domain-containing protein [Saprospiraceae bacterium]